MEWKLAIHPEVREWLHQQRKDRKTADLIASAIKYGLEQGPQGGRPLIDTLAGSRLKNLKELRPGSSGHSEIRILLIFDQGTHMALLVAGDKSGKWSKWYDEAIPEAERRYEAYQKGEW